MRPLWTVAEVVAATGGRPEGLLDGPISSVSIDSREIQPEALFVAIKGDKLDGHDYVKSALEAGAGAALVSEAWFKANGGENFAAIPCLNDSEAGMAVISHLVQRELQGWI